MTFLSVSIKSLLWLQWFPGQGSFPFTWLEGADPCH